MIVTTEADRQKEKVYRFKAKPEERKFIRLTADLYADGNFSRLVRHLLLSLWGDDVRRETMDIPLRVVNTDRYDIVPKVNI